MNAPTTPHNVVTSTEASSQPPSLAPSPVLDVDMAVVSSVSFGTSTGAAAAAGGSTTTTEMEVEDTAATETANPPNQQYLLHNTSTSPSTFNPASWTGQIIGSGGIDPHPTMMAQNQPTPTTAAATAFSTPSLIRDGPPSVDADSNHLLRSATLYASPDLAALTAIATTTTTSTLTTNHNNAATPSTMTMMNAATAAAPTNDMAAATGYGLGYGYGYGFGYHGYYTPSAAADHATSSMPAATAANLPTTTIDGRIVGAATSRDDLPPTGTTPPLPTPLPMSAPRHIRHPGMFAGTPIGDGHISRSFFTPGGNFANLYAPSVEDTTDPAATMATNMMGTSNPFGLSMANYDPTAGQQQGGQQQPRLNHPGAPSSLTVAAINASQMQVQPATGLQMAAMAAANTNEPAANSETMAADAAKKMSDTVAAVAIAQIEAEMEAEKQQQEESVRAAAKKNNVTKKKRGGSAAGSKAKKPKTTRKPRPLPTASNRSADSVAAATTVPVGDGNTTGRYGSSRVSDGASRPFTQEEKDATICHCKKSKCLKLYCDCFQSGAECKDDCKCKSCGNTASNPKRQGIIDKILARKPEAFMLGAAPKTNVGCRCKKSKCLKLYCACFKAGIDCSDECICTDCANISIGKDDDTKPAAEPAGTLEAAPAAPKPITPRDPPQSIAPAKAAEKIDVTPDSVYHPVISEHAAV